MAFENPRFSFLQFLVSQFLEGFSEKTYKKPALFIIHFQNPFQIVDVYEILRSGFLFSKISWPFQFNVHFFHFAPLLRKNLSKDPPIL